MADELRSGRIAVDPDDAGAGRSSRRTRRRSRGGGTSSSAHFLVVIPILGVIAAGWFIFNQQQQLGDAQRTLADAERRIAGLESRLRLTDEALSETGADTNEQMTFWESEIRKLWDMANKRNRGWIETNRANLQKLTTSVGTLESSLQTLRSTVAGIDASMSKQQEIGDLATALDMRVQRLTRDQRDLVDKVNSASQIANSLKASLESRVAENEEAIRAFDAHRQQINAELRQLRDLAGSPPASTPPVGP